MPTPTTRIAFSGGKPKVIDGPFADTKEIVAGYWILNANSKDEVLEWMKRAPFEDGEIEIRQIFEDADFAYAPEVMEHEKRLREQIAPTSAPLASVIDHHRAPTSARLALADPRVGVRFTISSAIARTRRRLRFE